MPPAKRTNRSGPVRHNTKMEKRQHPQQVVTDNTNVNNQSLLSAIQDLTKKVDEQGEEINELNPHNQPIFYASVYEHITPPQAPKASNKRSSGSNMEGTLPRKLIFEVKENDSQCDYIPMNNEELLNFFTNYERISHIRLLK